ncbi:hypothetical protein GWK47_033565 [Chionoecetes opilio]|uniref:Uncharacterized protein n=1 Tax=Chionoecetes opilio TaxID=41210 RepID=A0A8J5D3B1_CHIOP|nr:hypothetical protein GWK47_033565 [Chionoecetes opilio]
MIADTEHPGTDPTPKRPRLECIIHCSDDNENLISPQSVDSWKTLLRAAQIRRHEPILELAEDTPEGEIPALNYHRKCRSIFTMKKALDGILAQKEKTTNGCPEDSNPARAGRAIPSTSRTYEAECIFCQKTNKYAKRQKTREVLVKALVWTKCRTTKKHLWQRIEKEFGGFLHIIQDHNGKLLIYPDSLTVQEFVRENQSLKKQLKTLSRGSDDPDSIDSVTSRVQRLLQLFGQDIVYAVTCGKAKPPKQIALSSLSTRTKFGTKTLTRYADVDKIRRSQGQGVCDSLIGLHAFTGCDSVSCFAGKGKLIALTLLKKDPSNQAFKQLGQC